MTILSKLYKLRSTPLTRIINYAKARLSYRLGIERVLGYPISLFLEPFSACNLQCPLCPRGRGEIKRAGQLSFADFKLIIDKLGRYLHQISFSNFGEPLLNKELFDFIRLASDQGIHTCVYTNFQSPLGVVDRIIASGLKEITVSLDGVDQETYQKYRKGGNFHQVVSNIRELTKKKVTFPKVIVQFLVMKHNELQIEQFKKLATALNVDAIKIKALYLGAKYNLEDAYDFLPTDEYSKYLIADDKVVWKQKRVKKSYCYTPWHEITVLSDGSVLPCCYDVHGSSKLGNVLEERDFMKIWNGKLYRHWRRSVKRNENALCKNCPAMVLDFDKDFFFETETDD